MTRMRRSTRVAGLVTAVVLAAAGCAKAPDSAGKDDDQGASDFKACMVTDEGGIDDRSFNTLAWKGMTDAEEQYGVEVTYLESQSNADFIPNLEQFASQDCDLIVTVGFLLADATAQMAEKYPDQQFAIVDFAYPEPIPNVKPLVFDSSQSGFLAGYLAAGITETGTVAQYGGGKIPPVTLYMDGFAQGVEHYNSKHDTDVKMLGWDRQKQQGVFIGNFSDQAKGKTVTQNFISQGADVIFPLAGAVNLGTAAAVQDSSSEAKVIWVDSDGCVSAPEFCDLFWSSALKKIDVAVLTTIGQAAQGNFSNDAYVGTLANDGVGLADFHEHADDVPQELQDELQQVRQAISSGEISIDSQSKPTG